GNSSQICFAASPCVLGAASGGLSEYPAMAPSPVIAVTRPQVTSFQSRFLGNQCQSDQGDPMEWAPPGACVRRLRAGRDEGQAVWAGAASISASPAANSRHLALNRWQPARERKV